MEREISKNFGKMDLELIDAGSSPGGSSSRREGLRQSSRELNPALFGETASRARVIEGSLQAELPHTIQNDQRMNDFKAQMSMMAGNIGKLAQQFTEWAKWTRATDAKFDRIHTQLAKLEQNDHYIVNEAAQKFSHVNTRFGERKSIDLKIQEMMDRHNSLIKSFEMRLNQMQRILAEKEVQLLATTAALNESKMEIARLKRM